MSDVAENVPLQQHMDLSVLTGAAGMTQFRQRALKKQDTLAPGPLQHPALASASAKQAAPPAPLPDIAQTPSTHELIDTFWHS